MPPTLYGGIERIVDALVGEFRARGHEVGLVAHRDSTCRADFFAGWPGFKSQRAADTARNTLALRGAVGRFAPHVVHSFSRAIYLLPLMCGPRPLVMSYQRRPGRRPVAWAARLGGESITFTGCSEYICGVGRAAGGDWRAIHNFVDPRKYRFQPEVAPDAPLVFLSRVEELKGAHLAIEVARATGRRLLIAGNHGDSGPDGEYWETRIRPRLGDGIEYVGPVDDAHKEALLGQAAAMIVPVQWDEPFGIVFAEALACGTPVISCPRGALPEIVREGLDGFLVRGVGDACGAVRSLSRISRATCRRRAEETFSLPVIASRYETLYREVAGGP